MQGISSGNGAVGIEALGEKLTRQSKGCYVLGFDSHLCYPLVLKSKITEGHAIQLFFFVIQL